MKTLVSRLEEAGELFRLHEYDRAIALAAELYAEHPDARDVGALYASLLLQRARFDQAEPVTARLAEKNPDWPQALLNRGLLFVYQNRPAEAEPFLERAFLIGPDLPAVRAAWAHLRMVQHRYVTAAQIALEGLAKAPLHPDLLPVAYSCLSNTARPAEAAGLMRQAVQAHPDHHVLASGFCNSLNYVPDIAEPVILQAHQHYGRIYERGLRPLSPPPPAPDDPARPLRVGLLSSDLREHSVAYFLRPIFEHLDRSRFHLTALAICGKPDAMTQRLRDAADAWEDVLLLDAVRLARRIRELKIDILIETNGHTTDSRLSCLHLRPAPVQVSFLGYPNTTGLRAVGYRLVDALTDPPGSGCDAWHVERLQRIDGCAWCYAPPGPLPEPPARAPRGEGVTFGSFNALMKFNEPLVALWARLLEAVPASRLLIKNSGLVEPEARDMLRERFASCGIQPDRLELMGILPDRHAHLALYGRVDIALDTFPYHGTTTTCEALLMGTPTVSLAGAAHRSRVGLSLLSAVGLDSLCATTPAGFVEIARALATDMPRLDELHRTLRDRTLASPLCDAPGYARRFGDALSAIWRHACETARSAPAQTPPPPRPASGGSLYYGG